MLLGEIGGIRMAELPLGNLVAQALHAARILRFRRSRLLLRLKLRPPILLEINEGTYWLR